MKNKIFLLFLTFSLLIISCTSDDDQSEGNNNNILVNTTWEGNSAEDGIYTFTGNTSYTFKDPGEPFFDGTYTFDGRNGVLNEIISNSSFTFEVVGDTMVITYSVNNSRTYFKN